MTIPGVITIVIADDHPIFRDGLCGLLGAERDLEVVGVAADGIEAEALVRSKRPDILLLDVSMPLKPGIATLRDLESLSPAPRTILLTAQVDDQQVIEALRLGARGVVLKESATHDLLQCIRSVMAGRYWVRGAEIAIAEEAMKLATEARGPRSDRYRLTPRQVQIVNAVASGSTNRDIAQRLGISEDTVKQHLTAIFDKCGVSSRLELALLAVHQKIGGE